MYNEFLQKQIEIYFGTEKIPEKFEKLFRAISDTYENAKERRDMLERSIDMSLDEMIELNIKLSGESKRLKEAEKEMKTLFENIEDVYFSIDMKNHKVIDVSSACKKVYGFTPEEFKKNLNLWRTAIHPDDRHFFQEHDTELDKGKKVGYHYRIIHKDGSIHWIDAKVIPTLDEQGQLVRLDGVVRDVTEKKANENRAISTEQLLLEAQKLGNMGNWSHDIESDYLYWSEGLCEIYGVDTNITPTFEFFVSVILHPEDKDRLLKEVERVKQAGITSEVEYRILRMNDGQVRTVKNIMRAVNDTNGKTVRMFGMSRDITEHKKWEEKLESMNLSMYQVSHDLRGPLNSAKNYLYLALQKVNDKTALTYLSKINDSYSKMEHRVLSLLDIQRLNRAEANFEKIEIPVLLKEVISTIDGVTGFSDVTINTALRNAPHNFNSDKQFLHSILHNLISNAINYRRKDAKALINISAEVIDDMVVLKVADNGMGISETMKDSIFKKFAKGDTSANGVGLGLYIVKSLVTKLNGDIEVNSNHMKGTTFTVKLPTQPRMQANG